jgi:predicted dehydrogenase
MNLRIGFIGLGAMGLSHAKAINRLCADKAEITALCGTSDANFQAATEIAPSAKRFKEPAKVVTVEGGN